MIIKPLDKCDKKECKASKQSGDSYWCEDHRKGWKYLCIKSGIFENGNIPEDDIMILKAQYDEMV